MNRNEHLEWCKTRALEYVESNNLNGAIASMASDLTKHEGTINHPALTMMIQLKMMGQLNTPQQVFEFINGFN